MFEQSTRNTAMIIQGWWKIWVDEPTLLSKTKSRGALLKSTGNGPSKSELTGWGQMPTVRAPECIGWP